MDTGIADVSDLLRDSIEMHTHSAPSRIPRVVDDWELLKQANRFGMRGIVLKAHEGSTVERAFLINRRSKRVTFYGGLVLNHQVGGLNPAAVENALRLGAKIVWLPTFSADHHHDFYRRVERPFRPSGQSQFFSPGLSLLDENGRLHANVHEILDLVYSHDAILGTGHISPLEVQTVAEAFLSRDGARLLVTHADINISGIPMDLQIALAKKGAYLEKCFLALLEKWGGQPASQMVNGIRQLGVERCVGVTDAGMAELLPAPDCLLKFVAVLLEHGLRGEEIRQMIVSNPKDLLDISALSASSSEAGKAAGEIGN